MAFNAYIGFSPIFTIVKSTNRIIIEHINHNPHGKDASDKLNEEFVVLENEGTEKTSRLDPHRRDRYRSETTRLQVSTNSLHLLPREGLRSHRAGREFVGRR